MLNILKIKANGYKMLEKDFTIDFTAKARVYQEDKDKETIEIDKGLYLFRSTAIVGSNSSGKTTLLSLINKTFLFLQTGRWEYVQRDYKNNNIELEVVFYLDGKLYDYSVSFGKITFDNISPANKYAPILKENLVSMKYKKTNGIRNLDLLNIEGIEENNLFVYSLQDTSAITRITNGKIAVDDFTTNNASDFNSLLWRETFFECFNSCGKKLLSSIIKLLDESIEYIELGDLDYVRFKRKNEDEKILTKNDLVAILSSGTFRGVELYIRSINAIKNGKTMIVDEIENSFQKNLVYNLLFLFNDAVINSKNAKLIFSTHYIEILDYLNRRDDIFIMHQENGYINIKNLYSDYDVRTELLKSKQFDNNVFSTALNYEQLLTVRRNLVDELHSHNDWMAKLKGVYCIYARIFEEC